MNRAWNYWDAAPPVARESAMQVTLKLEAILARYTPDNAAAYPVEPGLTLGGLMARLGIREDEVMLAFVNGRPANLDTELPDRATVALCPYICGG